MRFVAVIGLIVVFLLLWFFVRPTYFPVSTITDYSEGVCTLTNNKCVWAGDACGGGHGKCTNNPEKYNSMASICDINNNFPANQGYKCTCLIAKGKCGWAK